MWLNQNRFHVKKIHICLYFALTQNPAIFFHSIDQRLPLHPHCSSRRRLYSDAPGSTSAAAAETSTPASHCISDSGFGQTYNQTAWFLTQSVILTQKVLTQSALTWSETIKRGLPESSTCKEEAQNKRRLRRKLMKC